MSRPVVPRSWASLTGYARSDVEEYAGSWLSPGRWPDIEWVERAEAHGADAIVGVRFITAGIVGGASEMLAYGTAVVVED